jgi:chaperonin GroES
MNLQPLDDRIVVRPSEAEETTASGLVIPDTAKEKPQQGEVLAVGPGRRADQTGEVIPMDVAVGDTVIYSKYGGTEIAFDGEVLAAAQWARPETTESLEEHGPQEQRLTYQCPRFLVSTKRPAGRSRRE